MWCQVRLYFLRNNPSIIYAIFYRGISIQTVVINCTLLLHYRHLHFQSENCKLRVFTRLSFIILTLLLVSMETLFVFLLCLVWYTTEAAVRAVLGFLFAWWRSRSVALSELRGCGWRSSTQSKASITIRHVMGLSALFEKRTDLQKKSFGVREEGGIFGGRYICVWGERLHMCVRLHLVCLNRWKTQTRPGKQWIEIWFCQLIVWTALTVFQPNKSFIIVTK